jgi:hypothetical protein
MTRQTHDSLVRAEDELLLQLRQLKDILTLPAFDVDLCQETSDHFNGFWQVPLVRMVIRRVF